METKPTSPKTENKLRIIAKELEKQMQCNCDPDNWEPEGYPQYSGHSWVCRIHKRSLLILHEDFKRSLSGAM